MRIFLASIVILLGANLAVDLMDSDMVELMQSVTNKSSEPSTGCDESDNLHTKQARPSKSCIV